MSLQLTGHTHFHIESTLQTSEDSDSLINVHEHSYMHDCGTSFKIITGKEQIDWYLINKRTPVGF